MKELIRKIIPKFLMNFYYFIFPFLGNVIYGCPSKKLKVIGITGTNGKSTVASLVCDVLEEAGFSVASISSIRFKIAEKEWENTLKMTMPGRMMVQRFLSQAVRAGCDYAVIEVTSEGIKQFRHKFIEFDVAVLTTLTAEHIESHGSFVKYKEAKGELFKSLLCGCVNQTEETLRTRKISIVNLDNPHADYFLGFSASDKYGFSIASFRDSERRKVIVNNKNVKAVAAEEVEILSDGIKFFFSGTEFNLKLIGKFNVYNALAAISVGISQGINLETIQKALTQVEKIPGRMEIIAVSPFTVIVDYAHTPDALEEVYCTIQNQLINSGKQKIRCVLGSAGGGRDKWKRPEMGKIAAKYCDQIILTNEDPYNEDPEQILSEIESGVIEGGKQDVAVKILDRREAIREILISASPGDVVMITGKGSEPWLMVKNKKISWDDREIVRMELNNVLNRMKKE